MDGKQTYGGVFLGFCGWIGKKDAESHIYRWQKE
jgi:hypothetical protein